MINYLNPINVGSNSGYFLRSETITLGLAIYYVNYVLHGPDLSSCVVSPFDEYGAPYSSDNITLLSLEGVLAVSAVVNVPDVTVDITYIVKDSDGFYVTSDLNSVRDGYGITANPPQGILRVVMNVSDGIWSGVNMGTQMLDVSQVLNNTFVT